MRGDARRASRMAARTHSFDGKRFFDESLGRGDQLRHALLGFREDRVAPAIQAESFLEDGQGAVERQVPPGQRTNRRPEGPGGLPKVRLFGPGSSSPSLT